MWIFTFVVALNSAFGAASHRDDLSKLVSSTHCRLIDSIQSLDADLRLNVYHSKDIADIESQAHSEARKIGHLGYDYGICKKEFVFTITAPSPISLTKAALSQLEPWCKNVEIVLGSKDPFRSFFKQLQISGTSSSKKLFPEMAQKEYSSSLICLPNTPWAGPITVGLIPPGYTIFA